MVKSFHTLQFLKNLLNVSGGQDKNKGGYTKLFPKILNIRDLLPQTVAIILHGALCKDTT